MSIKKEILKQDQGKESVYRFTIPNQTGDYVELTNLGGAVSGIHIHKLDGIMENISPNQNKASTYQQGTLLGGEFGRLLSGKVWDIAEEGENNVLLTCGLPAEENAAGTDLRIGMNVMWVNLNRLIIDYFITPKDKTNFKFATKLDLASSERTFLLRSFCPTVLRESGEQVKVEDSECKDLTFAPIDFNDSFICADEKMKPMIELSDEKSKLRISVYSTLSQAKTEETAAGVLSVICSEKDDIALEAGETLAHRMIFGFDYIEEQIEDDTEPSLFPFCF